MSPFLSETMKSPLLPPAPPLSFLLPGLSSATPPLPPPGFLLPAPLTPGLSPLLSLARAQHTVTRTGPGRRPKAGRNIVIEK